jgi:hypothetical protein
MRTENSLVSADALHAVELVRAIRDRQAAELAGKSPAEVLEHYQRAGDEARADARRWAEAHGVRAPGTF